jgi:hypothetical protein
MSKLTEEQILEIADMWNASTENWMQSLRRWNDLQPESDEFFKIPWGDAPAGVIDVEIAYRFGDKEGHDDYDIEYLYPKIPERFKKPVAHPHAEMIQKYAEVAQRRPDPWMEFAYFDRGEWCPILDEYSATFFVAEEYRFIGIN